MLSSDLSQLLCCDICSSLENVGSSGPRMWVVEEEHGSVSRQGLVPAVCV